MRRCVFHGESASAAHLPSTPADWLGLDLVERPADPGIIDIENTAAMDALARGAAAGIFELIRRCRGGMTVAEVTLASGLGPGAVVDAIDALTDAGLLRRIRARNGRGNRYAATCQRITIVADPHRDDHVTAVRNHFARATADIVEALAAAGTFDGALRNDQHRLDARVKLGLRAEEWVEFKRLSRALLDFLENVAQSRTGRVGDGPSLCDHVLSIQLTPCPSPLLPSPSIRVTSREHLGRSRDEEAFGAHARLTARERQVATLIATGLKRREIASRLGVSLNTVTTLASRAYGKLGVRSRGALQARLDRMPIDVADDADPS